jgi:Ni/Co efflux regulator RcnB
MTLKLCSIAAALALAVGMTAAPFAQAQSTMSKDANKAAAPTGDRSADRRSRTPRKTASKPITSRRRPSASR